MVRIVACPACGAPLAPGTARCAYCARYLKQAAGPGQATPATAKTAAAVPHASSPPGAGGRLFRRQTEPNEGAFSLSVPDGWLVEGGIVRADLMRQAVDAQSIAAKVDFAVKRDAAGSVQIRWCPEMRYCDLRVTPAGAMGLFPPGSVYQGMLVSPVVPAADFMVHTLFPWAHPRAGQVRVLARESLPPLAEAYRRRVLGSQGDRVVRSPRTGGTRCAF
jgi:hypothetical protein